ncbi:MAG: magnesium chelatase [Rhodothermales bacterium]
MAQPSPLIPTEASTLGDLKAHGYKPVSLKDELRRNLIAKIRSREPVFPGILGFDESVIPEIQNAILARHDFILLGLRGQAKSRLIRMLPNLMDEYIPVVRGTELNDDPFAPVSRKAREMVAEMKDETPIDWLHRSRRFGEKLATPDTTIADLIGDIDPIKAATRKLTYADEEVIHFGIIPRTNRGIFAVNELPDLRPRIQVGLLNVLEEQDIQIRGFAVRIPLDILLVFTANPEDYTNRGNIITPLKDRIDSQIITHYPRTIEIGIEITKQEAWEEREGPVSISVPSYFREIIEQVAFEARESDYVDQKSGVSVRLTRSALEDLISAAERRALAHGEDKTCVRISDLQFVEPAITGKVELVYEGEQEGAQNVARVLVGQAVKKTFERYFPSLGKRGAERSRYTEILSWFASGNNLELRSDLPFADFDRRLRAVPGLANLAEEFIDCGSRDEAPSAMEFVLEALHQNSLLGKDRLEGRASYTDMMGSMLSSIDPEDEDYS